MPLEQINIGAAPNDGTGDSLRVAFGKANAGIAKADTALQPEDLGPIADGLESIADAVEALAQ